MKLIFVACLASSFLYALPASAEIGAFSDLSQVEEFALQERDRVAPSGSIQSVEQFQQIQIPSSDVIYSSWFADDIKINKCLDEFRLIMEKNDAQSLDDLTEETRAQVTRIYSWVQNFSEIGEQETKVHFGTLIYMIMYDAFDLHSHISAHSQAEYTAAKDELFAVYASGMGALGTEIESAQCDDLSLGPLISDFRSERQDYDLLMKERLRRTIETVNSP